MFEIPVVYIWLYWFCILYSGESVPQALSFLYKLSLNSIDLVTPAVIQCDYLCLHVLNLISSSGKCLLNLALGTFSNFPKSIFGSDNRLAFMRHGISSLDSSSRKSCIAESLIDLVKIIFLVFGLRLEFWHLQYTENDEKFYLWLPTRRYQFPVNVEPCKTFG